MGRYLAPPDPYQNLETGCLKVYFPDDPFFFKALMGALSTLESRFIWDTGGDIDAADHIEQVWLQHGELTRATQDSGCQDTAECEETIIDLTNQVQELEQQIEEYENMNITVNCNCCNTVNGIQLPNPADYPCIPLNPDDPFDETVQTWDYGDEIPPAGYDDWQSFIDDRCRAANWFVDSYISMVGNLDLVERQLSIGGAVMDVAALVLAALPGPIGDWAGVAVMVKWVVLIADGLADVVEDLEDLGDWMQTSVDAIEANKEELICAAYRMTTVEYLTEFFTTFFGGYISPDLVAAGADTTAVDFMRDLMTPLATWLANKAANGFANQNIPDDYVPSVVCTNCQTGEVQVKSYANGGVVQETFDLDIGVPVWVSAYRSDAYGPFMELRFYDDQDQPLALQTEQVRILETSGWLQHNIAQHPFTIQTKQTDGANYLVDIAINQPIPTPHDITRTSGPNNLGIVEVCSAVAGDPNFQLRIMRLW